ncbi:OB-fold putative lipoprotein [Gemmata sp. JC717]|uniref:OB-fold putative lipoprotein n=1 Tax=Gemmata algarum TaxID=2975278 RepID=A0ABU5EUK8_9BACT|nr:OB-fold putative lipoprotein [Gemmata algarum]MDY3552492.1 OB-fold putative lipoprotein [Gemmata algarum]MDY3558924.1 OB-fold putative lipoprotein [Gemmata algarum]
MRDDYDRDREERRARRRLRREDRYESYRPTSTLGVVSLVGGILALVVSLIPCFGVVAVPVALVTLFLALLSLVVARQSGQAMGYPVAATAVSGSSLIVSLLWLAMFGAVFSEKHAARPPVPQVEGRPVPVPVPVPARKAQPEQKPPVDPKAADEAFEKKLLEDLAKDRIKEIIRNGPGIAVTAPNLEDEFDTNPVAADAQYKNKVLAVSGKVVRVVRDEPRGLYVLELATGNATKTVSCEFAAKTKDALASCKRGDEVKVRGLCAGRLNEFVKLTDCVVAN